MTIADMFARNRRANAIDAEWEERADERGFRERLREEVGKLRSGDVPGAAGELVEFLAGAGVDGARYALWLLLPVFRDEDLPGLAAATARISDPDVRLLAIFHLLGRARSAPVWWCEAARATLAAVENRTSKNLEAFLNNVRDAVEDPARFDLQSGYRAGARLFNARRYFEAHDVWEDVWRPNRDPERDFFRGLINLAVAFDKARKGNANGVARLVDRADALLAPFAPAHRGVDVAGLRATLAEARAEAAAWSAGTRNGIDAIPELPE